MMSVLDAPVEASTLSTKTSSCSADLSMGPSPLKKGTPGSWP